jgi:hypothetical protein
VVAGAAAMFLPNETRQKALVDVIE